ncbi:MAG TPA: Coenzyme F420 hydrogenase/dehydrogenase, beta subunit C-terminal domain [Clostridia bacterium]
MNYFETQDKSLCCGCTACASICPKSCITMTPDQDGFDYPVIDKARCINCELCKKVCPFANSDRLKNKAQDECYALAINDQEILYKSASGGAFTAIVNAFCDNNYRIFGSIMDSNLKVRHAYSDSIYDVSKFRKSKYVKSDINNTYYLAKKALNEGKKVLFTGTGCQIAGLKGYLQNDYDNLLTVDLICHGVPSQKLFDNYIEYLKRKHKQDIKNFIFRYKKSDSSNYIYYELENGKVNVKKGQLDYYMRAFLVNLMSMPACYNCHFACRERTGDITIADFWGIEHYNQNFNTGQGASLVIFNTEKGRKLINQLQNVKLFKTDINNAIKFNENLSRPSQLNKNRDKFLELARVNFKKAAKKYCKPSLKIRITAIMPNWMKKIIKALLKKLRIKI